MLHFNVFASYKRWIVCPLQPPPPPPKIQQPEIIEVPDEEEIEQADGVGTNWLEFECRKVTNSLRSIDQWYDPYDTKYYKGLWGEKYMEYRYKRHGIYEKDEHIRKSPYKVWDRAERGIKESMPTRAMKVAGK